MLLRLGRQADDFERSERLLEQSFVDAAPDPRLRAEIVIALNVTVFLRRGPAAAVKMARELAHVVEESGDLVLLAIFLARLSFSELIAGEVSPGLLERALELEQQVGPLPTATTPTFVEGLRLMYAEEHDAAREALQRGHSLGVARGYEPSTFQRAFSSWPSSSVAPVSGVALTSMPRQCSRPVRRGVSSWKGVRRSGSEDWSMPTWAVLTRLACARPREPGSRARRMTRLSSSGTSR